MVDLLALVIAFGATCFLGVVQGMASAIGFSLVVFVFNSSYPQIVELDAQNQEASPPLRKVCIAWIFESTHA
jgi:MFS superfamily sulfate permease-like transporter